MTNLRIDEENYMAVKAQAGELGMSVNEYLNKFLDKLSVYRELVPPGGRENGKRDAVWELGEVGKAVKKKPIGTLSPDDKLIYE